jgi:dihydrofolate reductase
MKKPTLSLIVAMAHDRVIGKEKKMPWHLPADLQYFRKKTLGKPVIMGRKTYESIGRPLPKRHNIIVSRNAGYEAEGCDVVTSLDEAMKAAEGAEEVFIIGGGFLYAETIDRADKLYLTFIDLKTEGDTYFPQYRHLRLKQIASEPHQRDENNPYDYEFAEFVVEK